MGCAEWSGVKGEKWNNCNSIINKLYLKTHTHGCSLYRHREREVKNRHTKDDNKKTNLVS